MTVTVPSIPRVKVYRWVKKSLFKNWWSGLITIVLFPLIVYGGYRFFRFAFFTGQWDAVRRNLTLFMQGTFPRDEQWRLVAQLVIFAIAFGIGAGTNAAARRDAAEDAGLPITQSSFLDTAKRMWSLGLFIASLLIFASTDEVGTFYGPFLLVLATAAVAFAGYQARRFARRWRNLGWLLVGILLLLGFQIVSGLDAGSWVPLGLVLGLVAYAAAPVDRIAAPALRFLAKLVTAAVVAVVVRFLYSLIDFEGIGWDEWSGLHLTLMVSAISIVLSFPLGLLLALARRSTLPALRWMATGYIELIRGVPLITLLFMGQFVLAFFFPTGTVLSDITRAIAAMSLFTSAYVAEIVRGGLQALPRGQTEASQALGMTPAATMRLIILPQALRSVIPAMVGQFISLFKDSSLLTIIGIAEFLGVREIVHAQPDFRGVAIAETLVFVAFGYWAFAFAMSRESQRLERRLRVS